MCILRAVQLLLALTQMDGIVRNLCVERNVPSGPLSIIAL
ncbi:hypothetical protein RGAI101_2064 [Roseobacter sp. GAI101]|nr:hypothetical protein RGAI101_2064 [Roseobacter sp. GAI101]